MRQAAILAALLTVPAGVGAQVNIDHAAAPTVTVRVYRTSLRPSDFRTAGELAGRVLHAAGIDVSWVQCWSGGQADEAVSAECARPLTASDLIVQPIRAADANAERHPDSLGFSLIDVQAAAGTVATVYTDRVLRMARKAGVDSVDLLAWAIAHEIGHLLLGTSEHAGGGLMRDRWSRAEVRRRLPQDWSFSVDEGQRMRKALRLRGTAQSALLAQSTVAN
jgi:hypothetical protein